MHCLGTKCSVNYKLPTVTLNLAGSLGPSASPNIKYASFKRNTVPPGLINCGYEDTVLHTDMVVTIVACRFVVVFAT